MDAADDESAYDHLTGLKALLFKSTPSGGTNRSMPTKDGSRRRRRANASSGQMATNNLIPDTLTTASFPSGSDSQPSMVASDPSFPGDRAVDVSDASATGSYPFSFGFSGLTSAGNVNAYQPYTSVPGTIGSTSYSYNDAWTSNMYGGANEQEQAILSSQMSRPLFDYGMTGGQSTDMDTGTYEEDFSMDISFSAVDTMQPSSSSLFNALGSGNVSASQPCTSVPGTIGSTSYSYNDAWTSNMYGGATIGANEQEQAILSSQMSRPLFDYGMTGGQSTDMDTRTHEEDSVTVLSMDARSPVVDTMKPSSSSLFNALG